MKKNVILGWCFYDFANASYSSVIAAVIFPVFYANRIVGNSAGLGDLWWGRAISVSMLIAAVSSPFAGGIADRAGRRKWFLFFYTMTCIFFVAMFSLLKPGAIVEGFLLIVAANTAREGGLVFYNAFLPDLAPWQYWGRVSAIGFALGYAGAICALLISLPMIKTGHFPYIWLSVSAFFLVFSLPAFFLLPRDVPAKDGVLRFAADGTKKAVSTIKGLWVRNRQSRRFLLAYLFYQDGVNTVIVFSSIFATVSLGFTARQLVLLYMVVQVTAFLGSVASAKPVDSWGPKKVIVLTLFLWILVTAAACAITQKGQFWAVACVAGLGLGSIQAASRALFSRFVPNGREAEYFGVYSMIGKTSAIAGPLIFGFVSHATGSQRPAIAAVGLLFVLGLAVISRFREPGPLRDGLGTDGQ